ncbi:hypothetical protein AAY473_030203 [Plecturocebus cupreus]
MHEMQSTKLMPKAGWRRRHVQSWGSPMKNRELEKQQSREKRRRQSRLQLEKGTWRTDSTKHFGRPRREDYLRSGVWDQPGQHGETPSLLNIEKLARHGDVVIPNFLKHDGAILWGEVPVDDGIVPHQVTTLIKGHLLPHIVGKV